MSADHDTPAEPPPPPPRRRSAFGNAVGLAGRSRPDAPRQSHVLTCPDCGAPRQGHDLSCQYCGGKTTE